jgi:Ankyrin repeats (3 copies)
MRLAIELVPRSLSEGYMRSLAKFAVLPNDDQKLVQSLFQWCVFAVRPMTTSELGVCLLAVDAETCSLNEDDIITEPDTLSSLTDGLVTLRDLPVAEKTDYGAREEVSQLTVLILAHKSIQDFILSADACGFQLQPEAVHATLATTCLAYLLLHDLAAPCVTWEEMRERLTEFPFLEYAARHWPSHLIQAQHDVTAMLLAEKLFTGPNFLPWLQIYKYHPGTRTARTYHKDARPLYWAARLELVPLLKKLLAHGADVNQPGGYFGTALHMAAFNGSTNVADVLLSHGADINLSVGTIGSPLRAATMGYQDEMIHFLLRKKANPDSTALELAKSTRQEVVTEALIREGAVDVSEKPSKEEACSEAKSLLLRAILEWDLSALQEALALGVDVNSPITIPGGKRAFPLLHALEVRMRKPEDGKGPDAVTHVDIMRGLIDAKADVNIHDGYHGSILALAAYWGDGDVVQLLLERGANPLLETYSGGGLYRTIYGMGKETKDAVSALLRAISDSTANCLMLIPP